ncbi:MAG: putative Ig domain-containing protein [Limisphaerales bacterium]
MEGDNQVGGCFDIEKPKFALVQGPAWLRMDEAAGILSGTPTATGRAEVTVSATIDQPVAMRASYGPQVRVIVPPHTLAGTNAASGSTSRSICRSFAYRANRKS